MQDHKQQTHQTGFTLLDMVLSLSILAITTAMAASSLKALHVQANPEKLASELKQELDSAALSSQSTGVPSTVRLTNNSRDLLFQVTGTQRTHRFQIPEALTVSEFRFGSVQGAAATLTLWPSGTASAGRITLSAPSGKSCSVIQSLRGARRVECTQ